MCVSGWRHCLTVAHSWFILYALWAGFGWTLSGGSHPYFIVNKPRTLIILPYKKTVHIHELISLLSATSLNQYICTSNIPCFPHLPPWPPCFSPIGDACCQSGLSFLLFSRQFISFKIENTKKPAHKMNWSLCARQRPTLTGA